MTRIFDDPAEFVKEALDGFAAVHGNQIARVDGGVVRATETPQGQVAVLIGGGSGHYPAFAGLVGPGLAAGAACGNIFSSPAAGQIYRVARIAETGGGVLLSYGNYAGDVMHFGLASQRLNAVGIETRTVLVTDDIASAPPDEADKRRGIAGDLTVFKIAGAAAESGLNLDEVERVARKANDRTRSLGVAFDGCTLPGADAPLFSVPEGRMSLGLGIHGEPGVSDHDMPTASELAQLLVSRLLDERPPGAELRVVAVLNGLGTVKYEELFLLYGKVKKLLLDAGLEIVEPECGELVTSLDMSGLSLTLLWLDDELERFWNAPADTPAYRKGNLERPARRPARELDVDTDIPREDAEEASVELASMAANMLEVVRKVLTENEKSLGDLDSFAGDGDHGIGMRRGAEAASKVARRATKDGRGVKEVLAMAGDAWSEQAGGTSGALWCAAL
ncbi:MAG TPA: dihydroxyacetone kinase family protein, partial [Microbacteriaceae bacterium]